MKQTLPRCVTSHVDTRSCDITYDELFSTVIARFSSLKRLWCVVPFKEKEMVTEFIFKGKAKKTRKFAAVKRMLNPNDIRLLVSKDLFRDKSSHSLSR